MKITKLKSFGSFGVKVTNIRYPFVDSETNKLAKLLKQELVLVLPQVHYTKEQFYELSGKLGSISTHGQQKDEPTTHLTGYLDDNNCPLFPGLDKVTAKKIKNTEKYSGVAAGFSKRLNWHCAEAERDNIKYSLQKNKTIEGRIERPLPEFVGLQGVTGTKGSVTQVCQTIDKFKEESKDHKEWLRGVRVRWNFIYGEEGVVPDIDDKYRNDEFGHKGDFMDKVQPLVQSCVNGHEGLHYSPSQVSEIVGGTPEEFKDFKDYFMKEYVQPKYIYDHEWQDGDIFYLDQKTCIHRRTDKNLNVSGLDMQYLEQRLLHRIEVHAMIEQIPTSGLNIHYSKSMKRRH